MLQVRLLSDANLAIIVQGSVHHTVHVIAGVRISLVAHMKEWRQDFTQEELFYINMARAFVEGFNDDITYTSVMNILKKLSSKLDEYEGIVMTYSKPKKKKSVKKPK